MRNIKADNRARSLQLNPRPRQLNPNSRIVIPPALTDMDHIRAERLRNFEDLRVKAIYSGK